MTTALSYADKSVNTKQEMEQEKKELDNSRLEELRFYNKIINTPKISTECKNGFRELRNKTMENNALFDVYLGGIGDNSQSNADIRLALSKSDSELQNLLKYLRSVACTPNDFKIIDYLDKTRKK